MTSLMLWKHDQRSLQGLHRVKSYSVSVAILKNAPVLAIVYENFAGCVLLIVEVK
ncbi:hypothetical protein YC2023_089022 [Brassica napus]